MLFSLCCHGQYYYQISPCTYQKEDLDVDQGRYITAICRLPNIVVIGLLIEMPGLFDSNQPISLLNVSNLVKTYFCLLQHKWAMEWINLSPWTFGQIKTLDSLNLLSLSSAIFLSNDAIFSSNSGFIASMSFFCFCSNWKHTNTMIRLRYVVARWVPFA